VSEGGEREEDGRRTGGGREEDGRRTRRRAGGYRTKNKTPHVNVGELWKITIFDG